MGREVLVDGVAEFLFFRTTEGLPPELGWASASLSSCSPPTEREKTRNPIGSEPHKLCRDSWACMMCFLSFLETTTRDWARSSRCVLEVSRHSQRTVHEFEAKLALWCPATFIGGGMIWVGSCFGAVLGRVDLVPVPLEWSSGVQAALTRPGVILTLEGNMERPQS